MLIFTIENVYSKFMVLNYHQHIDIFTFYGFDIDMRGELIFSLYHKKNLSNIKKISNKMLFVLYNINIKHVNLFKDVKYLFIYLLIKYSFDIFIE